MSSGKVVQSRAGTTQLRADGMLQVDCFAGAEIDINDAKELIAAQATLAAGTKRALLVNLGAIQSIDRTARTYLGGEEAAQNVKATALVISSRVGQVIGNFMTGLNKTLYPTRIFTAEADAIAWLQQYL